MTRKQAVRIERELRGMGVYKPYVSSDEVKRLWVESYPLSAVITQGFDAEMGPTHEVKISDWSQNGATISTERVFIGQDLVTRIGQMLIGLHGPAFERRIAQDAAAVEKNA